MTNENRQPNWLLNGAMLLLLFTGGALLLSYMNRPSLPHSAPIRMDEADQIQQKKKEKEFEFDMAIDNRDHYEAVKDFVKANEWQAKADALEEEIKELQDKLKELEEKGDQ